MLMRNCTNQIPHYSPGEEIANSVTHGIGTVLSVVGMAILIHRAISHGTVLHVVSFAIYGTALILVHFASTLYHALPRSRVKSLFRILDHCSIYLLIAGTYTPFLILCLWGRWGITLFVTVWVLAIVGILYKTMFLGRFKKSSVAMYLIMGWLIVVAAREVWLKVPHAALLYVALGGLLYTVGIVFFAWKRPYHHAIWHLFVLGGSACHYLGILLYLIPIKS